jgi:DNA (cytosine-5)-methyltransferase 1
VRHGFLSFFSGALGLDLGLEQAGLSPLGANEIDRHAVETIRANRPAFPLFACDIRSLGVGDFEQSPFAVVGGPPCQAFSTAGRRRGLADERGNVFLHFVDLAVALGPKYIVIENVRGLLSAPLVHRPLAERGDRPLEAEEQPGGALREIVSRLERGGYGVSFELYNVANFGVPQCRERVVMIAASGGRRVPHLCPSHVGHWETVRSALAGVERGEYVPFRRGREKYFRLISEGENWRSLPVRLQREALGGAFHSTGGRVGFCRRVAWDKPSPTLVTCPSMPATELGHPEELRPLSIGEYKRLQTFPDDWTVCGPLSAQYRQIGNAVPVEFGRAIGRHLLALEAGVSLEGSSVRLSRYRSTDEDSWRRRTA